MNATEVKADWLVWSNEHGAWWKPDHCGYTSDIGEAGRYTQQEAREIAFKANKYLPLDKPNEVAVPSPESVA